MINILRIFFGILVIILIIPQTPTENALLRKVHESGFFAYYTETKKFLTYLTWLSIILFLLFTFLSNYLS